MRKIKEKFNSLDFLRENLENIFPSIVLLLLVSVTLFTQFSYTSNTKSHTNTQTNIQNLQINALDEEINLFYSSELINENQSSILTNKINFKVNGDDFKNPLYAKNIVSDYSKDEEYDHAHEKNNVVISYTPLTQNYISSPLEQALDFGSNPIFEAFSGFDSVQGINQAQINVKVNQEFVLKFDEPPKQYLIDNLKFYPEANFDKIASGKDIIIKPKRLKRNTVYTFGLKLSLLCLFESDINCTNQKANDIFTHSVGFQTDWKEEYIYGYSHQNRPLIAYIFGVDDAQTSIMLTGGIHGNEHLSGDLTRFKNYLSLNPADLAGQSKKIILIPYTNPDGTALNQTDNSRGVNLNRNWDAQWATCSRCGSRANSENETSTLAKLTLDERVTHLISYHAQWPPNGIIFKGDDYNPRTDEFARWVSDRTGYPIGFFPGSPTVPGDQSVWGESKGIRSIIVEASYLTITEYNRNLPMYLDLVRYF